MEDREQQGGEGVHRKEGIHTSEEEIISFFATECGQVVRPADQVCQKVGCGGHVVDAKGVLA
jgi:hypothetical protein